MRTKTLLLTAALSAAGIATSMAQVYSVNAVGYVNISIVPGFNLISNPLKAQDNSIAALFRGGIQGTIPNNFTVYVFENGNFSDIAQWDDLAGTAGEFLPSTAAAKQIIPGGGVFVRNPSATPITVTFVGEVSQGALTHPVPVGFSIQSSEVPQEGTAAELGFPAGEDGDIIYQFDESIQNYLQPNQFDSLVGATGDWLPPLRPLAVGEAFFFLNKTAGAPWTRTFSVNQ